MVLRTSKEQTYTPHPKLDPVLTLVVSFRRPHKCTNILLFVFELVQSVAFSKLSCTCLRTYFPVLLWLYQQLAFQFP